MKKNLLLLISAFSFSITSNAQTDITLDIQSFIGPVNETTVNFTTSNSDLKVTFTDYNFEAVFFNGNNLSFFGSPFPAVGYFTVPFDNGDTDTLLFEAGGYFHTMYLNPYDLNTIENIGVDLTIYPNPTTDLLTITVGNYDGEFEVFDRSGRVLITTNDLQINVSKLHAGQYFLKVGSNTKLFIKE